MKWSIKRVQALSTSLWVLRAGITGILSVEVRRCSLSSIDVFFTALTHQRKNGIFEEINGCCVYVRHGVSPRSKHRQDARKEEVMEQLQNTASPPASTTPSAWTFREVVDAAIVLGCIPALVLSVIFWGGYGLPHTWWCDELTGHTAASGDGNGPDRALCGYHRPQHARLQPDVFRGADHGVRWGWVRLPRAGGEHRGLPFDSWFAGRLALYVAGCGSPVDWVSNLARVSRPWPLERQAASETLQRFFQANDDAGYHYSLIPGDSPRRHWLVRSASMQDMSGALVLFALPLCALVALLFLSANHLLQHRYRPIGTILTIKYGVPYN